VITCETGNSACPNTNMFMNATTNICYCDPTAIAATSTSCVCNRFATMTAGVCACETGYYAMKS